MAEFIKTDVSIVGKRTTISKVAEREKGEWILIHPIQSDDPGAYMCSKCKVGMWEVRPSSYHYFPNCGVKMEREEE